MYVLIIPQNIFFFEIILSNIIQCIPMPNSLYPEQSRRFDEPDLGPNCLLRLSADDTDIKIYKRRANTMNATLCLFCLLSPVLTVPV